MGLMWEKMMVGHILGGFDPLKNVRVVAEHKL